MTNRKSRFVALVLMLAMVLSLTAPIVPIAQAATTVSPTATGAQTPVASAAHVWDFESAEQAADFDLYHSADSSFSVQNGMLVPSGASGELKAISNVNVQDVKFVSVDIIPGQSGVINAGLYVGASNPGNEADQIDALAFLVESWFTGWNDAPNRIDLVTGEFPVWKVHKRLISETGNKNALFSNGVKEPLNLRVDFEGDIVTVTLSLVSNAGKYVQSVYACDPARLTGALGLRSNGSDVCFDNFKIGYDREVPETLQQGLAFSEPSAKAQLGSATGTVPQTVEAWVKIDTDTTATRSAIIGAFTGPATAQAQKGDWALFTDGNGKLWWYEKNTKGQYSSAKGPTIKTGDWTHVAITRTEGNIKYYINGSEVASVDSEKITLGAASTKAPTLGYCEYGGENYNYLDGQIGDVRLWSTARTAAEIQEDMFTEATANEAGLMSHWALDEQAGTVFWDSASTGNHGSIAKVSGLTWTEGSPVTEGLEFTSVGAKATLSQPTGTIPQTVEAWVKIDTDTAASRTGIISAFTGPYTADAQKGDWALFTDGSGKLWWYEKNAKGQYSSAKGVSVKTGEWTHVAITREDGLVKYYINGNEVASVTGNIALGEVSSKVPTLGYCEYGGENVNYLDGALGDVRLWSTTRTPEEIRATMYQQLTGTEEGLLSCWDLDEQGGVTLTDKAQAANHGTLDAAWLQDSQGLEFAGTQYPVATLSKSTGTVPQTVEAWVKIDTDTTATRSAIIGAFTGPATAQAQKGDWALFTDGNGKLWWYEKNTKGQYSSAKGVSIKTGNWTHVAITREEGTVKYYINGELVATNTGNVVLGQTSDKIPTLGYCEYSPDLHNYLDGALRDVRLWSTTRTAEEIKANMNTSLSGTEDGLISNWKLSEQSGSVIRDSAAAANDGTLAVGIDRTPGVQEDAPAAPEQTYENEGFNFSQNDVWITSENLDISPSHTVEAWVKIPKAVKSANVILQNNVLTRYEFSVTAGGNPRLYWKDENDTVTDIVVSGAKVNTGNWTHVAFVSNAEAQTVTCYVNGIAVYVAENVVLDDITTQKLYVGKPFQGLMGDLRVWDRALSASEIRSSMSTAYTEAQSGLLLNAPLDETAPTAFRDLSGNDNAIEVYERILNWTEDTTEPKDYSIVVIPDQQVLSSRYPQYLTQIYQWIAENAEEENIKFAINLGDVTDYNTEEEWLLSLEALDMIDGIVPYSFVPGNHEYFIPGSYKYADYGYRNLTEMNKYFGGIYDDQEEFGGTYDGGVENSWHEFEAFGNHYLVFAFEYAPRDSVLAWASEVIEAHPNHQVILSTHSYMDADGTLMGNTGHGAGYGFLYEEGKEDPNGARDMWDEFVSQHENIIMVLCGHIGTDNIVSRVDEGVNGNPVLQMLIDGQDLDGIYRGIGFLALMRFSADGEQMEVTYFSPYHGENGEDEILNDGITSYTLPAPKKPNAAQVGEKRYFTVSEAIAAANGQIVTVLSDTDEVITVTKDTVLDLAGHTLENVTVAEGATLYGIDTATDDYDCTDGYGKIIHLTGSFALHHKTEVDGNPQRYLAVTEADGVSFHRFYIGIQYITLRPGDTGFGYKAIFGGDEKVKDSLAEESAFGYNLWLTEDNVVNRYKDSEAFVTGQSGTPLTLCLSNFDTKNHGESPVHATVYITLSDGTVIESAEYSYSMRTMVERVNAEAENYSIEQLQAVANMILKDETMQTWEVANILDSLESETQ